MKQLVAALLGVAAAAVAGADGTAAGEPARLPTLLSLYGNDLAEAHRAVLSCKASSGAPLAGVGNTAQLRQDLGHYYCSRLEMEIELETRRLQHDELRVAAEKVIAAKPPLPGQSSPGSRPKSVSPVWIKSDDFSLSDFFRVHAVARVPAAFPGAAGGTGGAGGAGGATGRGQEGQAEGNDASVFAPSFVQDCADESGVADLQGSSSNKEIPLAMLCPQTLASGGYRPPSILAGDYLQRKSVRQAISASGRRIPGKGVDLASQWPSMTAASESGILHARQVEATRGSNQEP